MIVFENSNFILKIEPVCNFFLLMDIIYHAIPWSVFNSKNMVDHVSPWFVLTKNMVDHVSPCFF